MDLLRTPDARFENLPGYPFLPHYAEIDGIRIHYVDEGPADAAPVVLLHGEPSWSYLYRKMIPPIVAAGHRVVAPDLAGFGRSDKPARRKDYTCQRHVDWTRALLFDVLGLRQVTLFGQDWGGQIGLRHVAEQPDRFARVIAANTGLATGDFNPGEAFMLWRKFSQEVPEFPVGQIIQGATVTEVPDDVIAAYEAPFPDERYKEGARIFPSLVPISPDDPAAESNRKAWEALGKWKKPFLTAFSDSDPISAGWEQALLAHIPGTKDQPHTTIVGGGHFLQEDKGEELAQVVIDFIARTA